MTTLVKQDEWHDFRAGETVTIKGERGTEYTFKGVITNTKNGSQWADLYGGRKGKGPQLRGRTLGFRAVDPSRLKKVRSK